MLQQKQNHISWIISLILKKRHNNNGEHGDNHHQYNESEYKSHDQALVHSDFCAEHVDFKQVGFSLFFDLFHLYNFNCYYYPAECLSTLSINDKQTNYFILFNLLLPFFLQILQLDDLFLVLLGYHKRLLGRISLGDRGSSPTKLSCELMYYYSFSNLLLLFISSLLL